MNYKNTREAIFISRPNRFVATVKVDDQIETVHVKNTGRCEQLLLEGVKVILEASDNPNRKTKYDLIAVYKERFGWINIDSQAPNAVLGEWLKAGDTPFPDIAYLKPECVYGESRIDFYFETAERKVFIEAKGCTLEEMGMGLFPDAPTDRGVKHLKELTNAVKEGYECYVAFVIQMNGITHVKPNRAIQPEFADAMREAIKGGVKILNLRCHVEEDKVEAVSYGIIDCL